MATGVASAASVALLLSAAAPVVVADPSTLEPDLVTLAIQQEDLYMVRDGPKTLLRLTNEIGNRANGPLEVFPSTASSDCDGDGDPANDRDASQRIYADTNGSGAFERGADEVASERPFGCLRYHLAHDHWHLLDFSSYELRREPGGKPVALARKVGFCLTDARLAFAGPTAPVAPVYPISPASDRTCDEGSTQGISPGWADQYLFALPGQQINVTGLPSGHYCLTTRADPANVLEELDDDNNVRRVRLILRPSHLQVRKLYGRCRT